MNTEKIEIDLNKASTVEDAIALAKLALHAIQPDLKHLFVMPVMLERIPELKPLVKEE